MLTVSSITVTRPLQRRHRIVYLWLKFCESDVYRNQEETKKHEKLIKNKKYRCNGIVLYFTLQM